MRLTVISLLLGVVFQSHAATESTIVAKGPHHRVLQTTEQIQTPRGPKTVTNQIVEVQGGLHRSTEQGWVETSPGIELFRDGAIVRNLQYGAIFAPNLATPGAIDLSMPEGRLQGHLLGLAFTEGDRSVLISEVKDCAGVVAGDEQNELIFLDAFTDFDISVKFIVQRDRISQNIILHQQLPSPTEWGLTEDAVLEVLTEFTAFPELRKETREPMAGMNTEQLSFGSMEFVTGRAVSLDNEDNPVPMAKSWERFADNRWCLVERVRWRTMSPELAKLPPVAQGWQKRNNAVLIANQQLVARYLYDPFGAVLSLSGPLAEANLYRFSSKETHPQSGLLHYPYRYCEPGLQRWLNRDPLEEEDGPNMYRFADNSPVMFIDPDGRRLFAAWKCRRKMNKWYKKCIEEIPPCTREIGKGECPYDAPGQNPSNHWFECESKRKEKIGQCANDAKDMLEACMKATKPPSPSKR